MKDNDFLEINRETLAFALGFICHGHKNRTEQAADRQNALDKVRRLLEAPPRCPGCGYTEQDCREQMDHHLCGLPEPAKPRPIRFADLPMPSPLPVPAPAYWVDEFGCTIKADHKARNEALGGAPAKVVERYTAPLYFGPPDVELMRDALDHIAKTCHQSRQSTRRIRWIEARANGALEGKQYDAKLVELPLEVDREIDRFKRRDARQLARIKDLEALLREAHSYVNDVAHDPDVWLKIDAVLNPAPTKPACKTCGGDGYLAVPRTPGIDCPDCEPPPVAVLSGGRRAGKAHLAAQLESLAKQVYQSWESQPEFVPWVDGGNSLKQDEARQIASRMFELALANQVGD